MCPVVIGRVMTPTASSRRLVDPRVPRFGQGVTGTLLLVAWIADARWPAARAIVPALALVLGAAALLGGRWNLWSVIFQRVVARALRLGPPPVLKDAAPPRFAMTLGFAFLSAGSIALLAAPAPLDAYLGWGLALAVSALALLAAVSNVCVGCEIYVLVQRLRGASRGGTT